MKIYSETEIGNDCTFHSGCVIGSDGFGFSPNEKGEFTKIPQNVAYKMTGLDNETLEFNFVLS